MIPLSIHGQTAFVLVLAKQFKFGTGDRYVKETRRYMKKNTASLQLDDTRGPSISQRIRKTYEYSRSWCLWRPKPMVRNPSCSHLTHFASAGVPRVTLDLECDSCSEKDWQMMNPEQALILGARPKNLKFNLWDIRDRISWVSPDLCIILNSSIRICWKPCSQAKPTGFWPKGHSGILGSGPSCVTEIANPRHALHTDAWWKTLKQSVFVPSNRWERFCIREERTEYTDYSECTARCVCEDPLGYWTWSKGITKTNTHELQHCLSFPKMEFRPLCVAGQEWWWCGSFRKASIQELGQDACL